MKEKRIGKIILLSAFVLIICLSNVIWFFSAKYLDSGNYENRQLATKPTLSLDNYKTFSKEYTSYFNDNLQFRNNLITLNTGIDYFVFKKSSSEQVIIGDDNWLFYANVGDGDPVGCYQGTNLYSTEELQALADNCVRQRDLLQEQGMEFVIFIAPNKERIYSEYMPDQYGQPAENYRALQVYQYLKENTDLRIIYPYNELMQAKEAVDENIYSKTDTHWNYVGAYVGVTALCKELGIEMPSLASDEIRIIRGNHSSGDLSQMLNLQKQLAFADYDYTIEGYNPHDMAITEYDFNGAIICCAADADPRNIYMIRDSFCTHMVPFIGSQFTNCYLRHRSTYTYDDLVEHNPDIVVYETVERSVGELMNFSIGIAPSTIS